MAKKKKKPKPKKTEEEIQRDEYIKFVNKYRPTF